MQDWITAVSAIIAASTGIWSVWWQVRGKHDRLLVGIGSVSPTIEQETMLHVVNLSDHAIRLTDWGFIEENGTLTSLPLEYETMNLQSEEVQSRGSSMLMERGASFEQGYVRRRGPMGAFAYSITQTNPWVGFSPEVPVWRRLWVRLRIWGWRRYN